MSAQGDRREDMARLMEQYGSRLLRMCALQLGDRALAQDAVQETFLKAWRHIDSYRGEAGEMTWLFRIAVNVCPYGTIPHLTGILPCWPRGAKTDVKASGFEIVEDGSLQFDCNVELSNPIDQITIVPCRVSEKAAGSDGNLHPLPYATYQRQEPITEEQRQLMTVIDLK